MVLTRWTQGNSLSGPSQYNFHSPRAILSSTSSRSTGVDRLSSQSITTWSGCREPMVPTLRPVPMMLLSVSMAHLFLWDQRAQRVRSSPDRFLFGCQVALLGRKPTLASYPIHERNRIEPIGAFLLLVWALPEPMNRVSLTSLRMCHLCLCAYPSD